MKTLWIAAAALAVVAAGFTATAQASTVEMRVGQTKHITAYRGNGCGAPAPSFDQVMRRIPKSKLVTYSDGGLSSRVSKQCKRHVPTRAINGKAIRAGKETKRYQSGVVRLVVQ